MGGFDYGKSGDILKAIAHPVRLKMLTGLLQGEECNVTTMVKRLGIPQSTASQHLNVLKAQGIVTFRKEGVKTCYRVADARIKKIMEALKR
ncbi:MAG: winged helix-turn-helix transcriptional regulator [Candidatus Omnitrophica bacterium]|nr:winged helix-turn-helix transcriptional regulator [Candidatus Omnitrophota bacterium]